MTGPSWNQVLLIGAGGFLGSIARFLVAAGVQRWAHPSSFPYGTLAVNVVGCLLIGMAGGWSESRHALGPGTRLFLVVGMLGGFTTFSAFAFETLGLLQSGQGGAAFGNIVLQVGAGLLVAWMGFLLARQIF